MSDTQHLDEGQLHAYLDGEHGARQDVERHLAACAACRGRLEAERRVHDGARAILAAAGPANVTPPPFEAVRQRAAKQTRRAPVPRMVALAWAASLALAVTVGWYARNLVLARGEADVAAGAPAAPREVRGTAIQAAPPRAQQVAQAAPARSEAADEPGATMPETTGGAVAAPPPAPPAVAAAGDRAAANVVAAEAKAVRDVEPVAGRAAEAPPPAPAAAAPAAAAEGIRARRVSPEQMEQAWVTVSPAEAERRLGGTLAIIPGLPSLGTSVSGTGEATVARTLQVLGPGLTIELLQQRTTAGQRERAAAAPSLQVGKDLQAEPGQMLTLEWEGFSVTGRALVPADSLRRLLQSLTAARRY